MVVDTPEFPNLQAFHGGNPPAGSVLEWAIQTKETMGAGEVAALDAALGSVRARWSELTELKNDLFEPSTQPDNKWEKALCEMLAFAQLNKCGVLGQLNYFGNQTPDSSSAPLEGTLLIPNRGELPTLAFDVKSASGSGEEMLREAIQNAIDTRSDAAAIERFEVQLTLTGMANQKSANPGQLRSLDALVDAQWPRGTEPPQFPVTVSINGVGDVEIRASSDEIVVHERITASIDLDSACQQVVLDHATGKHKLLKPEDRLMLVYVKAPGRGMGDFRETHYLAAVCPGEVGGRHVSVAHQDLDRWLGVLLIDFTQPGFGGPRVSVFTRAIASWPTGLDEKQLLAALSGINSYHN